MGALPTALTLHLLLLLQSHGVKVHPHVHSTFIVNLLIDLFSYHAERWVTHNSRLSANLPGRSVASRTSAALLSTYEHLLSSSHRSESERCLILINDPS
jgi:hypothetical protein